MKHTILVVEDEKGIRETVSIFLKNQGYEVIQAQNGEEGLQMVAQHEIHLVIVDIMMPVMDGLTATKAIRALNRPDAGIIPIIAMTANAFAEDVQRCLDAGMNAHLAKPLDIEKVKKTICEHTIELYNKE